MIAEKLEDTNIHEILDAIGSDSRIGHKYLRAGLSYGGPCFPRDNRLVSYAARQVGLSAPLAEATRAELGRMLLPPQAGNSHEEILRNLFKVTQGRTERLSLNGLEATHFVGQRANARGQPEPIELTLVNGPADRRYVLMANGRDAAAVQRARPGLREAEASFRALTAADRAAARPWTIRSVALPAGGFAELARRSPLPQAERRLRLLNGIYAGGDLRPGQMVKVVE